MKKLLLLILCFCSTILYSQIVELNKLSNGKTISSQVLYDRESNDVYGYFFIFEKDKIDKKEYLYEYTLFDKNLNKVLEGNFTEKIGSWANKIKISAIYRDGYISFKMNDDRDSSMVYLRTRYRILDVKKNTITEAFSLNKKLERILDIETESTKNSITFSFYPTNSGYYLHTPIMTNQEKGLTKVQVNFNFLTDESRYNEIFYANAQLEPQWSYAYNTDGTSKKYESIYFTNDDNKTDLVLGVRRFEGYKNLDLVKKGQLFTSYLFFDKKTGDFINEFTPFGLNQIGDTKVKEVSNVTTFMNTNDKITFINNIMKEKEKHFFEKTEKLIGFSKAEYDIASGQCLNRNAFMWEQLSKYLPIDQYGYVREKGEPNSFLYLHDVLLQTNGNVLVILEQYKPLKGSNMIMQGSGVKIDDLFFVELDTKLQIVSYKRIAKTANNNRNGDGLMGLAAAKAFNAFDYAGYQDLGDNKYTFFYFNKQKPEDGGKKKWILGILQYDNGKITEEKLNLKSSDNSELSILPAKNGYILIAEKFKDKNKSTEFRLEKLN